MKRVVALAVAFMLLANSQIAVAERETGCGIKRWPVKTGTDADVTQLDLRTTTTTTIRAMRALPAPDDRPQDRRVVPTETTVFQIDAFITHYKREPDNDYHLVIEDEGKLTMVAEIPSPDCVKGNAPLRAQIASARAAFDSVLHATGQFTEASPPIPVELTGVGFFDMPDHGTGAPANGIELHPVLKIAFTSGPAAVAPATATGVTDAGFEDTPAAGWVATPGVITDSNKRGAHTGTHYAWLGGYGKRHTDTLTQQLAIPNASTVTLTYWLAVDTKERRNDEHYDLLTVDLVSTDGRRLTTLATYSNRDAAATYVRRTFDLAAYAGQTVVLSFRSDEDATFQTSFLIDDVSLEAK